MSSGARNALLGFVAGAATGALAGILFAPYKGSKTRKKLQKKVKEYSDDMTETLGEKVDHLKQQVNEMIHHVKEKAAEEEEKIKQKVKASVNTGGDGK